MAPLVKMIWGRIVFSTTADGAGTTERVRITSGGYFKASNNGTFVNSTGGIHEISQSAGSPRSLFKSKQQCVCKRYVCLPELQQSKCNFYFMVWQ